MIGIKAIGTYLPTGRISNLARLEDFGLTEDSLNNHIGFRQVAIKGSDESTLSLACSAFRNLVDQTGLDLGSVEAVAVVTQNPDRNIPHVSAELHGELALSTRCACFDISLGCSGYVYGLSLLSSFMSSHGMRQGVLVTADPYSMIVDPADKNTSLIFGDGAAATLLTSDPLYVAGSCRFGTMGSEANNLASTEGGLYMNGRAVFNFAAKYVPVEVVQVLQQNGLTLEQVDSFIFHQGSRFIVNTVADRLGIPRDKARFYAANYGNTVSSSIPIILAEEMKKLSNQLILLCGFGLGFSWASTVLKRLEVSE
ncbi:MAG: ketoacyl-ACP synthase III [Thermodesulfobacteriota bacterium]